MANGICISGSAFGSIILPPILRYLLEEYGYRGAILIMGGITLNTWVAALAYEPVENHMKRVPKQTFEDTTIDEEDEGITLEFTGTPEIKIEDSKLVTATTTTTANVSDEQSLAQISQNTQRNNGEFIRSVSAVAVQNFRNTNEEISRHRKISTPIRSNNSFINQLSSTSSLYAVPESRFSHSAIVIC